MSSRTCLPPALPVPLPAGLLPVPASTPEPGWSLEPGPEGAPLLVVLSGLPPEGAAAPAFEGRSLCRRLGVSGLLLRDARLSWFLRGVEGLGDDLPAVADAVRAQVEALAPRRVVLLGNSAGGYAAVALSTLLDADEVLAVVPRSGLGDEVNDGLGDDRFRDLRRAALHGLPAAAAPFLDLPGLLEEAFARRCADGRPAYRTRVRVLHASDNALDAAHAARLTGLPETVVATYPRGDHHLARVLRDAGELDALVAAALAGPRRRALVPA